MSYLCKNLCSSDCRPTSCKGVCLIGFLFLADAASDPHTGSLFSAFLLCDWVAIWRSCAHQLKDAVHIEQSTFHFTRLSSHIAPAPSQRLDQQLRGPGQFADISRVFGYKRLCSWWVCSAVH